MSRKSSSAVVIVAIVFLAVANGAQAGVGDHAGGALSSSKFMSPVEKAQYYSLDDNSNYCWYNNGWQGPGWYLCGDAWLNGFGWGGPYGWNGWDAGTGSGAMAPMELAFGILALRTRFSAARRLRVWGPASHRRPPPSRAAAFRLSIVSEAAAGLFMARAPAGRRCPLASRAAAFRLSMALAAAEVFMARARRRSGVPWLPGRRRPGFPGFGGGGGFHGFGGAGGFQGGGGGAFSFGGHGGGGHR